MTNFTNVQVASILRNAAAAHILQGGNRFQIAAYESAADSIEHATSEIKDIWEEGQLDRLPGIGSHIAGYLDELFKTGRVKHFEEVAKGLPSQTFLFLDIPGVGPKTALKIAQAKVESIPDLEKKIKNKNLLKKGFSEKSCENLLRGIAELQKRSHRLLLPVAAEIAAKLINYLKKLPEVEQIEPLGSLRRGVATIGDIDIAVASQNPKTVIDHFLNFPDKADTVEAGEKTATIVLHSGVSVDLMVQPPERFGSLLQHLTGSKAHNIKLRKIANEQGLSLSEYGIKQLDQKGDQFAQDLMLTCKTEEEFYQRLGLSFIPPELREDTGEIEAAKSKKLPELVEVGDIKGDLHLHTAWSDGVSSGNQILEKARQLGYEYVAITDHSYPNLDFKRRIKDIEQLKSSRVIKVLNGLEVNITVDGRMQVPDSILAQHDFIIASIHTAFHQSKEDITKRLLGALNNPYVNVIAHPTGRLLGEREGYEADWDRVFAACLKNKKALEINAWPSRLDLVDALVREAVKQGVKIIINTDAHEVSQMDIMRFGVTVAKRGWAKKSDILNTLPWVDFSKWFGIES